MPKVELTCEECGKRFMRYPSQVMEHNFCGLACSRKFTSARMTQFNQTENPMNSSAGWSQQQRDAVRKREQEAKDPCAKDTYPKNHGQHDHRVVAERMLGRKLKPGEVVHHINGDKHDNRPENLMVFKNSKEHMEYHRAHPEESGVTYAKKGVV